MAMFSASPAWSFTNSALASSSRAGLASHFGVDFFVKSSPSSAMASRSRARPGPVVCFQPSNNFPNCVPQSPMWLSLMTRWPSSRNERWSASPMPVERMWPTCIGFATFGELKSMTTVFGGAALRKTNARRARRFRAFASSTEFFSRKFRKPAPAISTFSQTRKRQLGQRHRWRVGADSVCAFWRATSARCSGSRQISDRTDGLERRRHRRPAKLRGRRLAASIQFVCVVNTAEI